MADEVMKIENPLVVMFEDEERKNVICHIYPTTRYDYRGYGLLVCDLVRHVAAAHKVDEDAVWEWVDKERRMHTTDIRSPH